jgi:hypothetical protein
MVFHMILNGIKRQMQDLMSETLCVGQFRRNALVWQRKLRIVDARLASCRLISQHAP